ncbi:Predicted PurR-regulated permease PerM [Sanguibacter gelidistatuariae]|uniref:Predicted PurR-regulated permease PerM n=1 Tax=Sanguibacter gelidistatuariae TaxID=1814289 RepID=A0A1G6QJT6_9MICO|nr:AI-2E family transporter [Sanguibacter gelidistatuariae]SDC91895.1 Predicted PurR-regulated permease PerM [Sanguibacter gelidistatuariae]
MGVDPQGTTDPHDAVAPGEGEGAPSATPATDEPQGTGEPSTTGHAFRVTSQTLGAATGARPRVGADAVAGSVRSAAAWAWRFLAIALGLAVVFSIIAYLKVIVVPVAIALLLTVLLQPLATFLRVRLRFAVGLAAATSVIGLIAAICGLVFIAGNEILKGFSDLRDKATEGLQQGLDWLSTGPLGLDSTTIEKYLDDALAAIEKNTGTLLSGALSVTTTVGQVLAGAVIALFCTLFFLMDGRRIWSWVVGLLPRHTRERTHQAGRRGLVTLASYARTQILVAFIDAVGIGAGAAILGVPLALPLAVLVFIGSFVPFVGAIFTGAMAVLVALVANGWPAGLIMLGVVLLVQQIESNVLQPWLMGQAVSMHPVAVLLVVTGGTLVAGIVGALFAVPIAAVLNTVVLYFHGHDKFPELGFDDHMSLRPAGRRAVMITSAEHLVGDAPGELPQATKGDS